MKIDLDRYIRMKEKLIEDFVNMRCRNCPNSERKCCGLHKDTNFAHSGCKNYHLVMKTVRRIEDSIQQAASQEGRPL